MRDCYCLVETGARLKDLYKEQREMFAVFMWKKKKYWKKKKKETYIVSNICSKNAISGLITKTLF